MGCQNHPHSRKLPALDAPTKDPAGRISQQTLWSGASGTVCAPPSSGTTPVAGDGNPADFPNQGLAPSELASPRSKPNTWEELHTLPLTRLCKNTPGFSPLPSHPLRQAQPESRGAAGTARPRREPSEGNFPDKRGYSRRDLPHRSSSATLRLGTLPPLLPDTTASDVPYLLFLLYRRTQQHPPPTPDQLLLANQDCCLTCSSSPGPGGVTPNLPWTPKLLLRPPHADVYFPAGFHLGSGQ